MCYTKFTEIRLITIGIATPLRILQWAEKTLPNGKIYGEVLNASTVHHDTFKPVNGGLFCERIFGPLKDFECACGKKEKIGQHSPNQKENHFQNGSVSHFKKEKSSLFEKKDVTCVRNNATPSFQGYNKKKKGLEQIHPQGGWDPLSASNSQTISTSKLEKKKRYFCPDCDVEYTWSIIRRYQLGYIKLTSPVIHSWFLNKTPSYLSLFLDFKKRDLQSFTYCVNTTTLEHSIMETSHFYTSEMERVRKRLLSFRFNTTDVETDQSLPDLYDQWLKGIKTPIPSLKSSRNTSFQNRLLKRNRFLKKTNLWEATRMKNEVLHTKELEKTAFSRLSFLQNSAFLFSYLSFLQDSFISNDCFLFLHNSSFFESFKLSSLSQIALSQLNFFLLHSKTGKLAFLLNKMKKKLPIVFYIRTHFEKRRDKKSILAFIVKSWHYVSQKAYLKALSQAPLYRWSTPFTKRGTPFSERVMQSKRVREKTNGSPEPSFFTLPKKRRNYSFEKLFFSFSQKNKANALKMSQTYLKRVIPFFKTYFKNTILTLLQTLKHSKSKHPFSTPHPKSSLEKDSFRKTNTFHSHYAHCLVSEATQMKNEVVEATQMKNKVVQKCLILSLSHVIHSKSEHLFSFRTKEKNLTKISDLLAQKGFLIPFVLGLFFDSIFSHCFQRKKNSLVLLPDNRDNGKKTSFSQRKNAFAIRDPEYTSLSPNTFQKNDQKCGPHDPVFQKTQPKKMFCFKKTLYQNQIVNLSKTLALEKNVLFTPLFPLSLTFFLRRERRDSFFLKREKRQFFFSQNHYFVSKAKKKNQLYNTIYTFSWREPWMNKRDEMQTWAFFSGYYSSFSFSDGKVNPIFAYKDRLAKVREFSKKATNSLFSGAGLIQKFVNELTRSEMQKLEKQNRFLLYMLTKCISKCKQKSHFFVYDKTTQMALRELCDKRDCLLRRRSLLRKFLNKGTQPSSLFLTVLPVLPPNLRPIVILEGQIAISDLNQFYQQIIDRNDRLNLFFKNRETRYSFEMKYAQCLLQESVDNLIQNNPTHGLKDSRGRAFKSLSDSLKGKQGRFRQFLLGKRVDYSGRSVIVVGPKLKLHQCGIPIEMAFELYLPFLLKRILNKNYAKTIVGAKMLMKKNRPFVLELLREIMHISPVLLNRAPTLHRLGFQAFVPKLVEGRALLLHPLVCSAFNADFDGDQMAVHVPITIEARTEAWKLMLSRTNMLSPATGDPLVLPSQDMVLGCYYLTTHRNQNTLSFLRGSGLFFQNFQKVLSAYELQKIDLHAWVWVKWAGTIEDGTEGKNGSNFPNSPLSSSGRGEEPIELRICKKGYWQELSSHYISHYDFHSHLISQYIATTPGRIVFHSLLHSLLERKT